MSDCLECISLSRDSVRLALADNLFAEPLGLEATIQDMQILNNVFAAPDNGLLRRNCAIGLDAKLEGCEERVGDFVGGEDNVIVLEETLGEEVAKCVVFLVEREYSGIGHT